MKLTWHNTSTDIAAQHANRVIEDLERMDVDRPSKLVFHHVFLGKDHNGPLVFVWGENGDDEGYHCEYVEKPEWKTSAELDAEKKIDNGDETC